MAGQLTLGTTELGDFVEFHEEIPEERRHNLVHVVSSLQHDAMNVEEVPLSHLRGEVADISYSKLNPEFLSMGVPLSLDIDGIPWVSGDKGEEIRVPRFSVYKRSERGFEGFYLSLSHCAHSYHPRSGVSVKIFSAAPNGPQGGIHPLLNHYLLRSLDFYDSQTLFELPMEVREKYLRAFPRSDPETIFKIGFYGIIPEATKERIREADEIFGEEVYLVAETTPEQWRKAQVVSLDPIIVGVYGAEREDSACYLVDHFNTTPYEDLIRREFRETSPSQS
jgi:hypothetical protein